MTMYRVYWLSHFFDKIMFFEFDDYTLARLYFNEKISRGYAKDVTLVQVIE